jgi:hypothetical protein
MAEYQQQQKEMLERTARLRAERLAREGKTRARKTSPGVAHKRGAADKSGAANTGDVA